MTNTNDTLRAEGRALDRHAAMMLAETCRGAELDGMPDQVAYWYVKYLRHSLKLFLHGMADNDEQRKMIEDEAIRLALIPPRPGEASTGLILPN